MFILNNEEDYYFILNIDKNATEEEIKNSYKELVKKYHPDINKENGSEEKFKKILKAYAILSDKDLKKEYDNSLQSNIKKSFKYNIDKFINKKEAIFKKINILFKNIYKKINKKIYINEIEEFFLSKITDNADNISLEEIELRLMHSQNEYLRAVSAIILGYREEKKSYHLLEKALKDESLEVRLCSIWALGNIGMKKSIILLKKIYENEINIKLKIIALYSIFKITKANPILFDDIIKNAINNENLELKEFAKNLYYYIKNDKLFNKIEENKNCIINEKVMFANLNNY